MPARARTTLCALLLMLPAAPAWSQEGGVADAPAPDKSAPSLEQKVSDLRQEVEDLKALVLSLQEQLQKANPPVAVIPAPAVPSTAAEVPVTTLAPSPLIALLPAGITVNGLLDGYYEYNLNSPIGRVNELRSYDVSSNNFSLNQADIIVERAADPAVGQRIGMRLDLQYGQATSTLQGNPVNELRPDVYRNVFQAYEPTCFPWPPA